MNPRYGSEDHGYCSAKCESGKFFFEVVSVYNAEKLLRVGGCAVRPVGTNLFTLGVGSVFKNVVTHVNEKFVGVAHFAVSFLTY